MTMLLLIPAAALACATFGGILRAGRACAEGRTWIVPSALFWCLTFAAGAAALFLAATGRPA